MILLWTVYGAHQRVLGSIIACSEACPGLMEEGATGLDPSRTVHANVRAIHDDVMLRMAGCGSRPPGCVHCGGWAAHSPHYVVPPPPPCGIPDDAAGSCGTTQTDDAAAPRLGAEVAWRGTTTRWQPGPTVAELAAPAAAADGWLAFHVGRPRKCVVGEAGAGGSALLGRCWPDPCLARGLCNAGRALAAGLRCGAPTDAGRQAGKKVTHVLKRCRHD